MSGEVRGQLLEAAGRLFYAQGVSATGINAITAEAGVAKMSLYNNFTSKDDLVRAYVQARHEELLGFYRARAEAALDAAGRVLAMFDAYLDHARTVSDDAFRGCGLLNVAAELPASDPIRIVIAGHKAEIEDLVRVELEGAGVHDPRGLAAHLSLLLEGAMSRAGLESSTRLLEHARALAERIVEES